MKKNTFLILMLTCWCLLILAMLAKLLGANWFIATTNNEKFINVCNYIDNHFWLKATIMSIMSVISCSIYYIAVLNTGKRKL